jgi:hypothetical protein
MLSNAAGSTSSLVASLAMISSLGQFAPFSGSPAPRRRRQVLPIFCRREWPPDKVRLTHLWSKPDSNSRSHRPFSLSVTQAERRSQ